jgi:hypothetical protein
MACAKIPPSNKWHEYPSYEFRGYEYKKPDRQRITEDVSKYVIETLFVLVFGIILVVIL